VPEEFVKNVKKFYEARIVKHLFHNDGEGNGEVRGGAGKGVKSYEYSSKLIVAINSVSLGEY
jgi:hypothetical protein